MIYKFISYLTFLKPKVFCFRSNFVLFTSIHLPVHIGLPAYGLMCELNTRSEVPTLAQWVCEACTLQSVV